MFVLLFGLLGVASIFPVGSHYMTEGEKFDFGSALAQNAFEDLETRGVLRPEVWLYASDELPSVTGGPEFIQPNGATSPGLFNVVIGNTGQEGQGHAFVIDPQGAAEGFTAGTDEVHFPYESHLLSNPNNPWFTSASLAGNIWPVRRMTLPTTAPLAAMTTETAETIFRLRDDLAVELPKEADRPGMQRWTTADPNNTPGNLNDDLLLSRQYNGNYSWLATVVPTSEQALLGLQPAHENYGQYTYEVSVVVFRKRDYVPSEESERLIDAEILNDGEVALYSPMGQDVDDAVEDIRPGNWICLMGVHKSSGNFLMKWYRLLSLDEETGDVLLRDNSGNFTRTEQGRYAMITGLDWPRGSYRDLRAAILPGAISVVTRRMKIGE